MPNHQATAIANEFLRRRDDDTWPQQMLIQKLAYIAHGWNLAINGEALINEAPQAWDNGPVFRSVWDHIKNYGYGKRRSLLVDPETRSEIVARLNKDERDVIEHVWRKYGGYDAQTLSKITHQSGTPWSKAYLRSRNAPLMTDEIKKYFVELALKSRGVDA